MSEALRYIPSVDKVLAAGPVAALVERFTRAGVLRAVRRLLDGLREEIRAGRGEVPSDPGDLAPRILALLEGGVARGMRRVINATGVVVHTGIGRSILPADALDAIREEVAGYCLLAIDRETTGRATRYRFCEELLSELTGAEACCLVNNNAAATMIVLNTFANGREVVLSRGQLVEIGGAYRIPDVLRRSGCTLVEVGCTNKTHLRDYEEAIGENTGLLMRIHTSNYRMVGFVKEVGIAEIAELGRRRGIPVVDDLGAGALLDLRPFGLPEEPLVRDSIEAGADAVTMSGDKLIGGPQCGIVVGPREPMERIHGNPLYRAMRTGKLTLVALEATLRYFLDRKRALAEHPTTRMLTVPLSELEARSRALAEGLAGIDGLAAEALPGESYAGSGSYPAHAIPTFVVAVAAEGISADDLALRLRMRPVGVFTRVREGRVTIDPRTLRPGEDAEVLAALRETAAD